MAPPSPSRSVSATHQPIANTAAVATISATSGGRIKAKKVMWSYSATPTGGKLTIASASTTIHEVDIPAAGPGWADLDGLETAVGEALSATLAGGSGSVLGKVTLTGERA